MEKQTDQKQMLRCIARDVLRNLWIAAALALSMSFFAVIGARLTYVPSYTSEMTVAVFQTGGFSSAYANMTQTQNIIETLQTIFSSQLMEKRVCDDLGVETLPGTIAVTSVPETNLVTLTATAGTPMGSFRILRSAVRVYPEMGEKTFGNLLAEVFRQPEIPDGPNNPFSGARVLRSAFVLCFLLAAGGMGVVFYLRDTVKTVEQAKNKLDTPLFATICHERPYKNGKDFLRRRRKSMLLSDPAVSFLYEETIKKISTKLLYQLGSDGEKIVLITSTEKGEGKSTIAMNLAQDLSRRGKRVLLIDGNLREPGLAAVLRLDRKKEVPDWGVALQKRIELTRAVYETGHYRFRMLLSRQPMPNATELLTAPALGRQLQQWRREADVIIVDGPPVRHRSDAEVWARYADLSLLVVRQNQAEAKYINDSIDMLEEYGSGVRGCIFNDALKASDHSPVGYSHYGYGYGQYGQYGKYGKYDRKDG